MTGRSGAIAGHQSSEGQTALEKVPRRLRPYRLVRSAGAEMGRSLKVRNYRLFTIGQVISLTGTWMQSTAQDWLVLTLSHNSPGAIGTVVALQFAPIMVVTLYAGLIADRFDKRRLMMVTQTALGVLALGMGLLVVSGYIQLWHVFVFAGLLGLCQAFDNPVRQAFVSELVGHELLGNAVALNSATFNSARVVGPAVGGLVIAAVGVGPSFLLNAATYVAVLFALWRMNPADLIRSRKLVRARGQLSEGLRYVAGRPDMLLVFTLVFVIGLLGVNFNFTIPLLARAEFHAGAASFGLLTTCFAIGALAGALVGTRRRSRPTAGLLLTMAAIFGALEFLLAFAPFFSAAGVLLVLIGGALIGCMNSANARVQLGSAAGFRGRVMSIYMLLFLGGTPLGAILVSWICELYGVRAGFVVGGLSVMLIALVLATVRAYWRRKRIPWPISPLAGPARH